MASYVWASYVVNSLLQAHNFSLVELEASFSDIHSSVASSAIVFINNFGRIYMLVLP